MPFNKFFPSPTRSLICCSFRYFVDLRGNKSSAYHTTFPHARVHQHALHISVRKHTRNSQSRSLRCNVLLPSILIDCARGSMDFAFAVIKLNKFRVGNCSLTEKSLATKSMSPLKKTHHQQQQKKTKTLTEKTNKRTPCHFR